MFWGPKERNLLQECKRVKRNVCRKLENEDLLGGGCRRAKGPVCPPPHYKERARPVSSPPPSPVSGTSKPCPLVSILYSHLL